MASERSPSDFSTLEIFLNKLHLHQNVLFQEQNSNAFLSLAYVPHPLPSENGLSPDDRITF